MKSDLLQDAIGLVRDEYIEDAHCPQSDVKARKKTGRPQLLFWGRWVAGVCAALIVVVGVWKSGVIKDLHDDPFWQNGTESESTEESAGETKVPDETEAPTNETLGMTEEMPPGTEAPIYGEDIIWLGKHTDVAENDLEFSSPVGQIPEKGVRLSMKFKTLLDQAEDTDRFAFVVSDMSYYDSAISEELKRELKEEKEKVSEVSNSCLERLMEEYGISRTEASARMFTDPIFVEARSRLQDILAQVYSIDILARYQSRHKMLDDLEALGLTVLYTAENETYRPYLGAFSGLGVMVGTKEEILALLDMKIPYYIKLYPAVEDAEKYRPATLETTGEEILLAGEGKLTVELVEAYEQSAGTALNVVIHVGYIGDDDGVLIKDELEAAAIKALGLTADAFWALVAGPDGSEWMDRLIAEKNRIVYNEDYQENVAESYLLEGELVDIVYHAWEIRAVMTYERAMKISKHKEIGYIDLKEK